MKWPIFVSDEWKYQVQSIGSGIGSRLKWRQAITWTKVDKNIWRNMLSLDLNRVTLLRTI